MRSRRWTQALGPPLFIALLSSGLVAQPLVSSVPARVPRDVAPGPASAVATLPSCPATDATPHKAGAWFRRDEVVDAGGQLTGYRLALGQTGSPDTIELTLEPESFASGPVDGRVLVGNDDGRRSAVWIVDVDRSCGTAVFEGADLVRRAALDPVGDSIVEYRLDRRTRADLGVWQRPLDGSPAFRLMEPLPASARIGRVFSTELGWSLDGERLAVSSCGEVACVTRVVDRGTGQVSTIDEAGVTELIGIVGDELVAYGGCPSLPCEIVAIDVASGGARHLADLAGLARLVDVEGRPGLAFEDYASAGEIRYVDVATGRITRIPMDDGLRLVAGSPQADGAIELPPGVIAASESGRPGPSDRPASFVRLADGTAITSEEVAR